MSTLLAAFSNTSFQHHDGVVTGHNDLLCSPLYLLHRRRTSGQLWQSHQLVPRQSLLTQALHMTGFWCTGMYFWYHVALHTSYLLRPVLIQVNNCLFQWEKNTSCSIQRQTVCAWLYDQCKGCSRTIWHKAFGLKSWLYCWSAQGTPLSPLSKYSSDHHRTAHLPLDFCSHGLVSKPGPLWSIYSPSAPWVTVSHFDREHTRGAQITEAGCHQASYLFASPTFLFSAKNHCFLGPFHSHLQFWEVASFAGQLYTHNILIASSQSCATKKRWITK